MKKIIFLTALILAVLVLSGAGCAWFPSEREEATNVPRETETNVNAPADPTAGWEVYESVPWAIEMKYPSTYKTVIDTYGWPHALVHFIEVAPGAQSYRAQIETWDNEGDFRTTYGRDPAYIVEHLNGKNWVTVDYNPNPTNPAVAEEWELIISTFRFTAP
ncbi:hypothetical protein HZB93_01965 [Candidatus Falkowbacteria bacterium]|nr:hypothetical protein [Candidatus Falkowbacteria bacterium]